jgi:hypothetical protein
MISAFFLARFAAIYPRLFLPVEQIFDSPQRKEWMLVKSNIIVVLVKNIKSIFIISGKIEPSTRKNIRVKLTEKKMSYQKTLSLM